LIIKGQQIQRNTTGDRNLLMIDIARAICPNGMRRGVLLVQVGITSEIIGLFSLGIWYAKN
jgi:hypothetical protein